MNNDLISRREVLFTLENVFEKYGISFGEGKRGFAEAVPKAIKVLPTAYDVDKVVKQLEEKAKGRLIQSSSPFDRWAGIAHAYQDSANTVKAGGVNE